MSHFTVLVAVPGYKVKSKDDVVSVAKEMLAPYQENNMGDCPEEYLKFFDVEEEHKQSYETDMESMVVLADGTRYSAYDIRFRSKDMNMLGNYEYPVDSKKEEVPVKELYSFDEYITNYCGYKKDKKTGRYGYYENGAKYLVDICASLYEEEKVLFGLQHESGDKEFLRNRAPQKWENLQRPILCMQEVFSKKEQNKDKRTASKVALESEIRAFLERLSIPDTETKRVLCDLWQAGEERQSLENNQVIGSRSLSQNRQGTRITLQQLQLTVGNGSRQYRFVTCGDKISHKAHFKEINLIGGAKWDWYQIGGRWTGFFPIKKNVLLGENAFVGSPGVLTPASKDQFRADVCQVKDLDRELIATEMHEAADNFWNKYQHLLETGNELGDDIFYGARFTAMKIGLAKVVNSESELTEEDKENKTYSWKDKFKVDDDRKDHFDVFRVLTKEKFLADYLEYFYPISTYALLTEKGWTEPGEMGWFGASSATPDSRMEFKSEFIKFMNDVPEDMWLVLVDCHI